MFLLAIDTSGIGSHVAVAHDGCIAGLASREGRETAEHLIALITDACCDAGCQLKDISKIVVATGPGSFTGIRTGLATAEGISFALQIPLIGMSVLLARASEKLFDNKPITASLVANRQEYFVCTMKKRGKTIESDGVRIVSCGEKYLRVDEDVLEKRPAEYLIDAFAKFADFCVPQELMELATAGSTVTGQYGKGVNARTLAERA